MRPQAEARVIRSAEVEPTSFGPLAEYRRLTGQDGLPRISPPNHRLLPASSSPIAISQNRADLLRR